MAVTDCFPVVDLFEERDPNSVRTTHLLAIIELLIELLGLRELGRPSHSRKQTHEYVPA